MINVKMDTKTVIKQFLQITKLIQDTSGLIHKTVLNTPSIKFLVNHLQ